ncbi:MAG: nuclear transport factor 2 family protein [Planctomycetota bacterium]
MKYASWISSLVVIVTGAWAVQDPHGPRLGSTPETCVRAWYSALENEDLGAVLAIYEDSPEVTAITSNGPVHRGLKEIRELYARAFEQADFEEAVLLDMRVRARAETAWVTGRFESRSRVRLDDSRWLLTLRATLVLVKTEGGWRIAHEHLSTIPGTERLRRLGDR